VFIQAAGKLVVTADCLQSFVDTKNREWAKLGGQVVIG
jgi:hypothetical protein